MIFHFLFFPLFLIGIVAAGKFFLHVSLKIIKVPGYSPGDLGLLGMAGLFFMGLSGVVVNFGVPLSSALFLVFLTICSISGVVLMVISRNHLSYASVLVFILLSAILAPLAGSLSPEYDGGLYHLPFQLWVRTEAIVVGLANFHGRFGFGSLYEYVSAPFWIGETFTLLSYLQVSFLVFFLLFLIEQARISEATPLALLAGISVNIAVFYSYMYLDYAKHPYLGSTYTDLPSGLLFGASFIYGQWLLYMQKPSSRAEWLVFTLLILSSFLYKISAVLLIFWFGFVVIYRIVYKRDPIRECVIGSALPALFLLIYLLRNIISTGCLFYPAASTCLDLPWSATDNAINDSNWATAFAREPHTNLRSLHDHRWFLNWWLPNYQPFLLQLFIAGMGACSIYIISALLHRFRSIRILDSRLWAGCGFVLAAFLFWFWLGPTPRFGIGVFIVLFPTLYLFICGRQLEQSHKWNTSLQVLIFICIIIFTCRVGTPWKLLSSGNLIKLHVHTVPQTEHVEDSVYGNRPLNTDMCWLIPECAPYDRPPKAQRYGRSIFYNSSEKATESR